MGVFCQHLFWQASLYALAALTAFFGGLASTWLGVDDHLPAWTRNEDLRFGFIAVGSLCAVSAGHGWQTRRLVGRAFKVLGDASYGIYLIHVVFMVAAVYVIRRVHTPTSYPMTVALVLAIALPPSIMFGPLDVRIQHALKGLQRRLGGARRAGLSVP